MKPGCFLKNQAPHGQSFGLETLLLEIFGASGLASGVGMILGLRGCFKRAKEGIGSERVIK